VPLTSGDALRGLLPQVKDPRTSALLVEAARIADRLDDIDAIIAGNGVLDLLRFRLVDDEGRVAEVKFDNVMSEARQQAMAFRAILAQLGAEKFEAGAKAGGSILDQLAERRAAREAAAEGSASSAVGLGD
jgi:hypothetical protein